MSTPPLGYTRVTEVLEPYSKLNAIDPAILSTAADRGRRVHDYCEQYANGLFVVDVDQDCKGYFESFCYWFDKRVDKVISTEKRFNDHDLRLTGCCDLIVKLKEEPEIVLIDIKTPASSSSTWQLQTAAYQYLTHKNGVLIDRRAVLQLPKSGGNPKFIEYIHHKADENLFFAAFQLHRFFKM